MKNLREYCPACDATVEVREASKCWGVEWRCIICGSVTDQDIDDDCQDYVSFLDDDPEEE